jgi:hypothetical protein
MTGRFLTGLCLITLAAGAWASPSGLNNIPTADVAPFGKLVLQQYTNIGGGEPPAFYVGAKWGGLPRVEVGIDDRLAGGGAPTASPVGQIKFQVLRNDKRLSLAVGAANLGDNKRNGSPALYLALKRSLVPRVRGHLGFMNQGSQDSFFVGLDGKLVRGWDWRLDAIQTNHMHDVLFGVGAIGPLGQNMLLETWASLPTQAGADESCMLKFNCVIGK